MRQKYKISIIIRTKNEEKWITSCLESISRQRYKDFEIVLVDNCSTDKTVEKAKNFGVKVVNIEEFFPGNAINVGINASSGEYIACISGHCIPVNEYWLENLLRNFDHPEIAGVYGRQEPMAFTNDLDKRDLINLFGLDRRVQVKDSFFHNANSMFRRDVWQKIPFDDRVTNIEDRIWAKNILEKGYKLVYEPDASVYHYHGINQGRNISRAQKIVRILESLDSNNKSSPTLAGLNTISIIPATGKVLKLNGRPLIEHTIETAKNSKYINDIYVTTDSNEYKDVAENLGAHVPFLRPKEFSYDYIELIKIYRFTLEKLNQKGIDPDLVVLMEENYPFRPAGLIDRMIESLVFDNYDTVFAARPEYKLCLSKHNDVFVRLDKGVMPNKFKDPIYVSLLGLGCVTHPNLIYEEKKIGDKVGIIEVDNPFSGIEIRNNDTLLFAEKLMQNWHDFQK